MISRSSKARFMGRELTELADSMGDIPAGISKECVGMYSVAFLLALVAWDCNASGKNWDLLRDRYGEVWEAWLISHDANLDV